MEKLLLPVIFILLTLVSRAQNSFPASGNTLIGTNTDVPSAILNVSSNTQGILVPRMTTSQRDAIVSPAAALIIYNSTTSSLDYYTGTGWVNIPSGSLTAWGLTGNSIIPGQFLGSTNNENLRFRTNNIERMVVDNIGNVGIGKTTPTAKVDIWETSLANSGSLAGSALNIGQTWNTGGSPTAIKLNITNSASSALSTLMDLQINGLSRYRFGLNSCAFYTGTSGNQGMFYISNTGMTFLTQTPGNLAYSFGGTLNSPASGAVTQMLINGNNPFAPTSGNATFTALSIAQVINQSVGVTGITRGIYINPTLTAAYNWRSVEFSNNTGWGLYGAGSAKNYLAGSLLMGTTTDVPSAVLNITSTSKGALLPRMTNAQMNGVASPADGLLVYNNEETAFYYYKSNTWTKIGAGDAAVSPWSITGTNTNVFNTNTGSVFIGLTAPGYILDEGNFKLYVDKGIRTKKVKVDQSTWADYVFEKDYPLPSINEVEAFIRTNKHLKGVQSTEEVRKEGLDLGENQAVMLQKIEELTLYIIDQNKKSAAQQQQILDLQTQLLELKALVTKKQN